MAQVTAAGVNTPGSRRRRGVKSGSGGEVGRGQDRGGAGACIRARARWVSLLAPAVCSCTALLCFCSAPAPLPSHPPPRIFSSGPNSLGTPGFPLRFGGCCRRLHRGEPGARWSSLTVAAAAAAPSRRRPRRSVGVGRRERGFPARGRRPPCPASARRPPSAAPSKREGRRPRQGAARGQGGRIQWKYVTSCRCCLWTGRSPSVLSRRGAISFSSSSRLFGCPNPRQLSQVTPPPGPHTWGLLFCLPPSTWLHLRDPYSPVLAVHPDQHFPLFGDV